MVTRNLFDSATDPNECPPEFPNCTEPRVSSPASALVEPLLDTNTETAPNECPPEFPNCTEPHVGSPDPVLVERAA
ncbi:MAG TPA: hypothetical protein VF516_04260 [Kofleriaceae bacterium]